MEEANITILSLPQFASHEKFIFTFLPKMEGDIGRFQIKTNIYNEWGSIDVNFGLEVYNEPPLFLTKPEDI